jgi:hypothetical protein
MTDKRRPGRPEIGGRVTIALGADRLARIDRDRSSQSRAEWLRAAADAHLTARTAKPDTEETQP